MDKETFRRNLLSQARNDRLHKLVDLAAEGRKLVDAERYRTKAQLLVQEIVFANADLESNSSDQFAKYANCKYAADAIISYLDEVGAPVSQEQLISELTTGGFRGGDSRSCYLSVMKSILAYTQGKASSNPRIKKLGALIGRIDWEDSRFKVLTEKSCN